MPKSGFARQVSCKRPVKLPVQPKSGHKENPFDSKAGPGNSQLNPTYSYETPFFVVPEMCISGRFRGVFFYIGTMGLITIRYFFSKWDDHPS